MATDNEKPIKEVPPYISSATFDNALASVVEHGVPQQVDRSVLSKFAGGTIRQLIQAFEYLRLIEEDGRPTDVLKAYEKADPDGRKTILAAQLRKCYPHQVSILPDGTPQQLQSSFSQFSIEPSVRAKCIAFLLGMAKRAGLPIGKHIAKSNRVRGPRKAAKAKPTTDRLKRPKGAEVHEEIHDADDMVSTMIPVGPGKAWRIVTTKQPSKDEVSRFLQMVGIVLGVAKGEGQR